MESALPHHTTQLGTLPIKKLFWKYALPSIFAMLVSGIYSIVGGIFVGRYVGSEGLAAIGLAYPVVIIQIGLGGLVGMGGATWIALLQGRKKHIAAKQALVNTVWLLLALGAILPIVGLRYLNHILRFLGAGQTSIIWEEAQTYLQWMLGGSFWVCASLAVSFLIRNDGRPRLATVLLAAGALGNILFDLLFIVILDLGLAGAALAALLAEGSIAIVGLGYFFTKHAHLSLTIRSVFIPHLPSMLPLLALGLSSLAMELNFAFLLFAHNNQLLAYGSEPELAAYAVAGYTESLFLLVIHGLAVGMQPILGYAMGAGQQQRVHETLRHGLRMALIFGIIGLVLVEACPWLIAQLYIDNSDPMLMQLSTTALRLHLITMPLESFIIVAMVALQSMGLTRIALASTLSKTVLLVPALWWLPDWLGVNGIWLAVPIVNSVLMLPMAILLAKIMIKK